MNPSDVSPTVSEAVRSAPGGGTRISRAVYVLVALAAFVGLLTLAGLVSGLLWLAESSHGQQAIRILAVIGPLALGATSCGLLLAAIALVRRIEHLGEHIDALAHTTSSLAEQTAIRSRPLPAPPAPALDPQLIYRSLAQIEETLLLPDEQRQRRYQSRVALEIQKGLAEIDRFVGSRDFHHARERLALLVTRFGPDDRLREAQVKLVQAIEAVQAEDTQQTSQKVTALMSLNRWDDAERLARELADKYPGAAAPLALIEQVCRERQLFEQRHRQRLHDEIQQAVNQRRWQDAARAARQFIATFPIGPDTEALKAQLETLDANAEIQIRQELEQALKDRLREQRYWDALEIARRILSEYPFSPQANALRGQLPRLEELARNSPR